jgi:hypothetical protein
VTNICSKIYGMLHRLRLLKYITPKHIRLKLCKALLLPTFFYSDIIYTDLRSVDSRRLEVAFNSCTRYVYSLRRFDHLGPFRNMLLGLPLSKYFDYRVVCFFFKVLFYRRPTYLFTDLRRGSDRTGNFPTEICSWPKISNFVVSFQFYVIEKTNMILTVSYLIGTRHSFLMCHMLPESCMHTQ